MLPVVYVRILVIYQGAKHNDSQKHRAEGKSMAQPTRQRKQTVDGRRVWTERAAQENATKRQPRTLNAGR